MYKLVPTLISIMGETYPELKTAENLIIETLKDEEDKFRNTLNKGLKNKRGGKKEGSNNGLR